MIGKATPAQRGDGKCDRADEHEGSCDRANAVARRLHTAIVRGKNNPAGFGSTGISLIEMPSRSGRSFARRQHQLARFRRHGDNVLIGGFIVGSGSSGRVAVRALGPSLNAAGIAGALADQSWNCTTLTARCLEPTTAGKLIQRDRITRRGSCPNNANEAAILSPLGSRPIHGGGSRSRRKYRRRPC